MNRIDIIIPVYRGEAQTRACIESVLSAKNIQPLDIVVVNDASPEPEIGNYLLQLANAARITLVTNNTNLGFVASCNMAMRLHPQRDVVLLNSDTLVADRWLDRMIASVASVPFCASITPFSNNATLCSYPRIAVANELPSGMSHTAIDAIFAAVNVGRTVEIPTAVGFCMMMKRDAIDAIGMFDTDAFGRGYGEENDWCMRATAQGFSHQLCADVYVYHQGEVSFGGDATAGKKQAQTVIDGRYPEYGALISKHLAKDPARLLRRRVDIARLAASIRPRVLFMTHNWGGGTEKHVNDLATMLADSLDVLVLKPHNEQSLSLRWMRDGEEFEAYFEDRKDPTELLSLLRAIGISRVHLHHVHGLPAYLLDIHFELNVPLDITLHDYFPLTQRYHLGAGGTLDSMAEAPANDWGYTETHWRQRMSSLLLSATRVIAPSIDLAERMQRYFPDIRLLVHGHPDEESPPCIAPYKVLVLGGLTGEKGLKVLEACAKDAQARKLPLFFKLIGHTSANIAKFPELPIAISGTYRETDLDQLISLERADAFLFPAQIPESYSYTLTHAIRSSLPIVASALGAFIERLKFNPLARTIPWNALPPVWNDNLLAAIVQHSKNPDESQRTGATKQSRQDYKNWYLGVFGKQTSPMSLVDIDFPQHTWYAPKIEGLRKEYSLKQLFEVGVDCGHVPSLSELRRRVAIADEQLAAATCEIAAISRDVATAHIEIAETRVRMAVADGRIDEDRVHIGILTSEIEQSRDRFIGMQDRLEGERDVARKAFDAVISSRSWRITAPLRSFVERARDIHLRISELCGMLRRFPHYMAIARQILKAEGFGALIARVRLKSRQRLPLLAVAKSYPVQIVIKPLTIKSSDTPKYSLVIPVYDQHLLTYNCLRSIAETCTSLDIEVLVVDDCSPHPAAEELASIAGITLLRNDSNLGFLASCNYGAKHAKGEFLVILNNDLILTGDWLKKLEAVYAQFPNTGLVGAKLIYPDGRLQEAGGIVWRDGSAWNVGRGDDAAKPEYNYVREVDYCSGACLLIDREFWNALGGFDIAYKPAYYEDTDLAFRVREHGKRVFYQPHATVVHFEGQSSGTDLTQGVKRHQVFNQKTFAARWEKVLDAHRPNGMWAHKERNRYTSTHILVVDACMLTPDQDAGSLRMFEMLGLMRAMGNQVTFVAANLEYRLPYVTDIQAIGVEVLHHPFASSISGHLQKHGSDYDIVLLSRETVASQYLEVVRRFATQAKVIFDTVDLHFLRAEREAALMNDVALRTAARSTRERELALINDADVTLVVSTAEQELLLRLTPHADVQIVSTIHVSKPGSKTFLERDGILFIGGFRHPPNLDAVIWYVENVMPILREKHPGLVTTVIGSNAPATLQRYAGHDFVIAGFVPDVTAHYNSTRLSISPLRYGAGVKGKVNLAMQYGVPVVATTISVEGMHLIAGESVLVSDDAEAFADSIVQLHTDEELWNRLRQGGLQNIEEWFSRNAAQRTMASVFSALPNARAR